MDIFSGLLHPMSCTEWCVAHYRISAESSSVEGRFAPAPYQRAMMDIFGMAGGPERICLLKAARVGYTSAMVGTICYMMAHARRHVLLYMPNDADARKVSKDTIAPALRDCRPTSRMLEALTDKRGDDTAIYRNLQGKTLRIAGAVAPANYRRVSTDLVLLDECDSYPDDIGGEGDAVMLAWRAARNSPFRRQIIGSTPADESMSMVWREYQEAQVRFHYAVACPHCDSMIELKWEHVRFAPRQDGEEGDPNAIVRRAESAVYESQCCGKTWDQSHLAGALEGGRWETDGGTYIIDAETSPPRMIDALGNQHPWPKTLGFYIWSWYSPFEPWSGHVASFLKAVGDTAQMKAWRAHVLGLPFRDAATSMTEDDLMAHQVIALPNEAKCMVLGVDVQQDWLSVLVVAWGSGPRGWIVDRLEFHGDTETPESQTWRDFNTWLSRRPRWEREDGTELGVDLVAIDSGYHTDTVYRMSRRLRTERIMVVKGRGTVDAPVVKSPPQKWQSSDGKRGVFWLVGTHQTKHAVVSMMVSGRIHPFDTLPAEVAGELTSEELVAKKVNGRITKRWRPKQARNEALDCLVYSYAGVVKMAPPWLNVGLDETQESGEQAPKPTEKKRAAPKARVRPTTRRRKRRAW